MDLGRSLRSIIAGIGRHLKDVQQSNDPRLLDKEKGCFPKLYNALCRQFSERIPLAVYLAVKDYL